MGNVHPIPRPALAGPADARLLQQRQANFPRPVQDFRELLHRRLGPLGEQETAFGPTLHAERAVPVLSGEPEAREALAAGTDVPEGGPARETEPEAESALPALEPFALLLSSISAAAPAAPEQCRATFAPELIASEVVRSIAWGGDRRRGAARIELAGDRFGGTRVVVEVHEQQVRLSLDAPSGVTAEDIAELESRLRARFAERGLEVERA